jgi:hypothetical protein
VDGLSINVKASVKVATTATGDLATAFAADQLVDGIALVTGDRILIKDQTTASENGIYVVTATAPTRASDFNSNGTYKGAFTFVEQGTVNAARGFVCTTTGTITIDTTSITFTQFSSAQLGSDSVTTAKILDANVTAAKLATDSVTTAKILDANVTTLKIADSAVTNAKIAANTIDLTTKVTGVLPVANGGTGVVSTVTTSSDLAGAGTYIIQPTDAIQTFKLPSLSTGSVITLYGGGVNAFSITGVDAITILNGTAIVNGNLKIVCAAASTVVCIATSATAWVAYVNGTYPTPAA